jgi:lysophospholipase L1-like esterase
MSAFFVFVLPPVLFGGAAFLYLRRRKRINAPATLWSLLAGNALILLFLLTLIFLGFESYYRFFYDQTDAMADTLVSTDWYRRHYHRNNIGVRDNINYEYARAPGKRRITFVGDSFLAGFGVRDVEDRFANRIRRLHPEWEVHAVAQPGLETSNEVEAIHNLVVSNHYGLDLLVLVYNMNDIGEVMPNWIAEYKKMLADPFRNSWLCRNSYVINLYYHRAQVRRNAYFKNYFDELEAAYAGPLFEKHKIALTAMCNMTIIRGGRLVVVTFPFMHDPQRFKAAHERMNQFWQEHNVPHLDLLPLFSNLPPASITVNAHDTHPNERAHALVAEKIDSFLQQIIKQQ